MNNIVINGNLTNDITVTANKNGEKLVVFNIAHNSYKSDKPMYLHIVTKGEPAKFAEKWLKKGSSVEVTGELSITEYISDKTGEKYVNSNVFANSLSFYGNYRKKGDVETA